MKKGFLVYLDQESIVEKLSDQDAGKLFKSFFRYNRAQEIPDFDDRLSMVFEFFKIAFDRDSKKYEEKCRKNRENINKRWNTNVYDGIRTNTNYTNIDTDRDRDIDRDIDTDTDRDRKRPREPPPADYTSVDYWKGVAKQEKIRVDDKIIEALCDQIKSEGGRTLWRDPITDPGRALGGFKKHYRKPDKETRKPNSFHNFDQRDYDYDELEKRLTGRGHQNGQEEDRDHLTDS